MSVAFRALFLASLLIATAGQAQSGNERPELKLKKIIFDQTTTELSGIAPYKASWLIVSDDPTDHYIYKISLEGKRFTHKPFIDYEKLAGYKEYKIAAAKRQNRTMNNYRLDQEGIAVCGDTFYVIDERVRNVIKIEGGKFVALPIDYGAHREMYDGEANAGLEGIAVDCTGKKLYLAKERDPRFLVSIDLATLKILNVGDLPPSDRDNQKVINFKTGQGLMTLSMDFSDLYFDNGYLYVLERNAYQIAKVDPETFKVLARVSFFFSAKDLYSTGEPFGILEALTLSKDEIILGTDNNDSPVSGITEKTYGVSGDHPALLFFDRPKGF